MHIRFIFVMGLLSLYGLFSISLEQQNLLLRRNISQQEYRLDVLENQIIQQHVELNVHLSPTQLAETEITPAPVDNTGEFIDE